jgi:hypothetical protein
MPGNNTFDDIIRQAIAEGFAKNLRPSEEIEDRRDVDPTWDTTMKARAMVDRLLGRKKVDGLEGMMPYPDYEPPPDTYIDQTVVDPKLPQ